jgi:hypothetical protein
VIDRDDLSWVRLRWPQIEVVLSSASPKPTVEVAGEALGVDHFHYSTLDHINSGEGKIERLRELYEGVNAEVEIVGISDTSRGEDHCWAEHFTRVVDINSPTPFPAIVSARSPLLEVHSATVLTKHERERRSAGDADYLDPRRTKLMPSHGRPLELTGEDLERRLGWLLERVNALASAPGNITGDIAYRLALLQEASTSVLRA